jgi:hypothetical protein
LKRVFFVFLGVHLLWSMSTPTFATAVRHYPFQDIAIQCRILVLLGLVYVSLFVSGAVFFSVCPSLYLLDSARANSSSAVSFQFAMAAEKVALGRARRARRSGTERVIIKPRGWGDGGGRELRTCCRPYEQGERGSHTLQVPVSDIRARRSVKKGTHMELSNEGERVRKTQAVQLARTAHVNI